MIKVRFDATRVDGPLYFDCDGHADYKNPVTGNNDACVAMSAICTMLALHMDEVYGIEPVICRDGHVRFDIKSSDLKIKEVFEVAMRGIRWVSEAYPGSIKLY